MGPEELGGWPGKPCEKIAGDNNYWVIKLNGDSFTGLIFNNGSGAQTGNIEPPQNGFLYSATNTTGSAYTGPTETNPVTPPVVDEYPEHVYLIGSNNSWGTSNAPEADTAADGVYTWNKVTMPEADGNYFTFITAQAPSWDAAGGVAGVNDSNRYGATSKDEVVTLDQAMTVKLYAANVNASGAHSWKIDAGDYKVVLDLTAMNVTVSKVADDPIVTPTLPEHVYLMGSNNAWDIQNAPEAETAVDGVYTWKNVKMLEPMSYFSFMTALGTSAVDYTNVNAHDRYGCPTEDETVTLGTPMTVKVFKGGEDAVNCTTWVCDQGTYNIVLDLNNMTMTATKAGDDPVVNPDPEFPAHVYLVGGNNNWNATNAPEADSAADGVYTWNSVTMPEGTDSYFSFITTLSSTTADDWTEINANTRYGASTDGEDVVFDQAMAVTSNKGQVPAWKVAGGDYKFVLDLNKMSLTVSKVAGPVNPDTYPEHVYLIGSNNSWGTTDAPEADTAAEGVYTWNSVTMPELTGDATANYFSFITALAPAWDATDGVAGVNDFNRYGAATKDEAVTLDQAMTVVLFEANVNASSANSWTIGAGDFKVVLDLAAMTVTVSKLGEDGIEAIEADANAEAVYYTLQGVRVANPTAGIYVKVANGKATKVAIR